MTDDDKAVGKRFDETIRQRAGVAAPHEPNAGDEPTGNNEPPASGFDGGARGTAVAPNNFDALIRESAGY